MRITAALRRSGFVLPALALLALLAVPAALAQDAAPTDAEPPSDETAPEEEVSVLEGWVTDTEGEPVPGATVLAVSAEAKSRYRPRGPLAFASQGLRKDYPLGETVADEEGRFSIEASGPAPFTLRAEAEGFAPSQTRDVRPGDMVTIVLGAGWTLQGRVVDHASGLPVPGAEVVARPQVGDGFRDPDDPERFHLTAKADDEGWFVIADIEANFYTVSARSEGYAGEARPGVGVGLDGSEPAAVHLYLRPGVALVGKVVDAEGTPIEGASVSAGPGGVIPENIEAWMRSVDLTETTDEDGRFEIAGVPRARAYTLTATHDEFASTWEENVRAREGRRSSPVSLTMTRGTSLTGRLMIDDETAFEGKPTVTLVYEGGNRMNRGGRRVRRSGDELPLEDGHFTVDRLPEGKASLTVDFDGYADIEREALVLKSGEPFELGTLLVDTGPVIEGVVRDAKGKPIAEARVTASSVFAGGFSRESAETDDEGRFSIGGLDGEMAFTLRAEAEGFGPESKEEVRPDREPVELTLQQAGAIVGRVVTGDPPRPLIGFTIEPHGKADEGFGMPMRMAGLGPRPERFREPDGSFTLGSLAAGDYTLKVAAEGFIPSRVEKIEVGAGDTVDVGDVFMDRGSTLRGVVVTRETGEPVAGATIAVEDPGVFQNPMLRAGRGEASLMSDPEGRFTLTGLAPGQHTFKAQHENFAPEKTEVEIEAGVPPADLTIELGPGGRIEGIVRDKSGQPLAGGMVIAMAGFMPDARTITSTDTYGYYHLDNLAPGGYRVMAMPQPTGNSSRDQGAMLGQMQMAMAQVEEGETTVVDLPKQEGAIKVRGVVRKGRASVESRLFFAMLSADGSTATDFRGAITDGGGNYEVVLSEPGTYQVFITPKGEDRDPMAPGIRIDVEIPEEPEVTRDLVIPAISLAGRVTDEETAEPVSGVRVWALRVDPDNSDPARDDVTTSGQTDADGMYRLEGLEAASYRLIFSKDGYEETPLGPLELDEDDQLDGLDVILREGHPIVVSVVDENGNPVEGAFIMPLEFSMAFLGGSGGTTDVDGSLIIRGLREGNHDIGAIARGFAPGVAENVLAGPEGDKRVKIRLRRGGSLTVRVIDVDENPVANALVRVRELEGPDLTRLFRFSGALAGQSVVTGPEGELALSHLDSGRYEVEVEAGQLSAIETVRVRSGKHVDLEVALR